VRYVSHWPLGVPLLWLAVYLPGGTLRKLGSLKRCAYTATKLWTGTRNVIRRSGEGCSLLGQHGARMVARVTRPTQRSASSFTGRGFSTTRLVDGARRLAGRDRRSGAAYVERARAYCE